MSNRKEEILIVALHLFARDGYEAVSVSQIAGELDMTKGALYRHYKSKRDIFDCIVQRMEHYVLNQLRNDPAFVPELDFVMYQDGKLIGQNIFVRTAITADDGRSIPMFG